MKKYILFIFLLLPAKFIAQEYTVETVPNPHVTDVANYVSNPDGILNEQTVQQINAELQSLEAGTKAEVAVVVLHSIGDEEIVDFGVRLFEKWGIGKKEVDNGLLILFVEDQRAIRFEVGYGLEGVVTDALSKRIQTQQMIPHFKEGDYNAGLLAGVQSVASLIRKEPVLEIEEPPIFEGITWQTALIGYFVLAFISFIWIANIAQSVKKEKKLQTNVARYLAIKSRRKSIYSVMAILVPLAGLLFFVFFGGLKYVLLIIPIPLTILPAELYARIQMRMVRRKPFPCRSDNGMMHILSEKEDDKYLTDSQRFEEKIKSVDYDVFLCDNCQETKVFPLDLKSIYIKCPFCGTKAFKRIDSQIVSAATYSSAGLKKVNYQCEFCGKDGSKDETIPKLRQTSVAGPIIGGGLGGFGGSRGGGFGGGGSFGGGHSGGGGSTSRW